MLIAKRMQRKRTTPKGSNNEGRQYFYRHLIPQGLLKNVKDSPDIWYELVLLNDEGYNGFTWHDDATEFAKKARETSEKAD